MHKFILPILFCVILSNALRAQPATALWHTNNIFQTQYFIENKGQFEQMQDHAKQVQYAIQHHGDEYYFTEKGFSVKLGKRTIKENYKEEKEKKRNKFERESEEEREREQRLKYDMKTTWVDVEWLNTNKNVQLIPSAKTNHYITYGEAKYNSYGYKTITYQNMYNGIDIVYELHPQGGIEYTLHIKPGADLSLVKYKYKGENLKIETTTRGLVIHNKVKDLEEKDLYCYYSDNKNIPVKIKYNVASDGISFSMLEPQNTSKTLIIDPWVTAVNNFPGALQSDNCAYDVDNDAQGNLFAFGGGGDVGSSSTSFPKVAKYDISGAIQWTFSGVIVAPSWNSSPGSVSGGYARAGNFVVNKQNSKCYISQGLNISATGAIIVRIDPNGVYDNFITASNSNFQEIWEMKMSCITSEVMGIGGGTNSNINFGVIDTTTGIVNNTNVTSLPQAGQDAINASIGPNGEVYIIFVNVGTNDIYKLNAANTGYVWNAASGSSNFSEQGNKPYTNNSAFSNGHNCLSSNQNYLFFYDGAVLKAFNISTGAQVGSSMSILGTPLNKGGIYANTCDEVFVGGDNGDVKKYLFNGSNFSLLSTLTIPGQANKNVHDIILNANNNALYVCGDGFVAAVDPVTNCINATVGSIQLTSQIICPDTGVVTITNPNTTLSYSFIWQDSITNTIIQSGLQAPGVISNKCGGLIANKTYKVTVIQASACQIVSNVIYVKAICAGINVNLCPGATYTLSNGTVLTQAGIYSDTLTNSQGQDSIITVSLTYLPVVNVSIFDTICNGQSHTLPNGNQVTTAGTYTNTYTGFNGCDSIITTKLEVVPMPNIRLGNDMELCAGESIKLDVTNSNNPYITYLWHDNSILPILTVNTAGIFYVSGSAPPCPTQRDTIQINSIDCNCTEIIPNAFSPNGDIRNETFKPNIQCKYPLQYYSMLIYNRWGQEVFKTNDLLKGWDGKFQGEIQEIGTYYYYITYTNPKTNKKETFKGDISLIR